MKRTTLSVCMFGIAIAFGLPICAIAQTVLRVDGVDGSLVTASPPADGSDWGVDAFLLLQDALAQAAIATPPVEIWVRGDDTETGLTYYPDRDSGSPSGDNDPDATFALLESVAIYGGFAGTETVKNARNSRLYKTVLSGNIGNGEDETDNSHHVVTASQTNSTAIIDGFWIQDGYALGAEAIVGGDADSEEAGAGMAIIGSGGINSSTATNPIILRCRFVNNEAARGAAVYIHAGQQNRPDFRDCEFAYNVASDAGAGVFVDDAGGQETGSAPEFISCLFHHNTSTSTGVALRSVGYSNPILRNCTYSRNSCVADGAAITNDVDEESEGTSRTAEILMRSTIVWNNDRDDGGGPVADLAAQLSGAMNIDYSCIQDFGSPYPANNNIDDDPLFADAESDFRLICGSPCHDTGSSTNYPMDAFDVAQDGTSNDSTTPQPDVDIQQRILDVIEIGCYELIAEPCLADVNDDGEVNVTDLPAVIGAWGACPSPPTACPADVAPGPCATDADGVVDTTDMLLVIAQWGDCPGGEESLTSGGEGGMSEEDAATFRACVDAAIELDLEGQEFVDYVVNCLCEAGLIECE